jgi:formyltetrahydrofolate deformylase
MNNNYILTFSCPDQYGIQAKVTGFLFKENAFLKDIHSYSDEDTKIFFSRIVFSLKNNKIPSNSFNKSFEDIAKDLSIKWELSKEGEKIKTIIAVSKQGHCLNDLLYRANYRKMPIDIVGVVSNHEDFRGIVEFSGIKFHYLPVSSDKKNKPKQENEFANLVDSKDADLIVLARYMQIISPSLSAKWFGKCINIHHSFLPSFKGARAYHQAHNRGVKIIGATTHYVTPDLDEGPIIDQDIERVSHKNTPNELIQKGNDIEARVLARSVKWHAEKRILLNGKKTIVFE